MEGKLARLFGAGVLIASLGMEACSGSRPPSPPELTAIAKEKEERGAQEKLTRGFVEAAMRLDKEAMMLLVTPTTRGNPKTSGFIDRVVEIVAGCDPSQITNFVPGTRSIGGTKETWGSVDFRRECGPRLENSRYDRLSGILSIGFPLDLSSEGGPFIFPGGGINTIREIEGSRQKVSIAIKDD